MSGKKVLFLDRDGTLIVEPPDHQIDSLQKLKLIDGVIPALLKLRDAGYTFVMVSNQDGLGTQSFPEPTFTEAHEFLRELLKSQGIVFEREFICPHFASDGCDCRKPKTGLLNAYLNETSIDPSSSFVIGDRETDLTLAKNLGLAGLRIGTGEDEKWDAIAERLTAS